MRGIRWGEAAELDQAFAPERTDGTLHRQRMGQLAQRLRSFADLQQDFPLAGTQLTGGSIGAGAKGQQHKPTLHGVATIHIGQVGLQHGEHLGEAMAQ